MLCSGIANSCHISSVELEDISHVPMTKKKEIAAKEKEVKKRGYVNSPNFENKIPSLRYCARSFLNFMGKKF
jgi:hypothetical protein